MKALFEKEGGGGGAPFVCPATESNKPTPPTQPSCTIWYLQLKDPITLSVLTESQPQSCLVVGENM